MSLLDYASAEGDSYHHQRHRHLRSMREDAVLREAWGCYARQVYFKGLQSGQSVLEVGAGFGNNLLGIQKEAEVLALEPARSAREYIQSLGFQTAAALEEITPQRRFDFILLRHVLEHVPEPYALLKTLQAYLKPQGRLIVVVPAESPGLKPKADDTDHHLYSWNLRTLRNLMESAGCGDVRVRFNALNGRKFFLPLYRLCGPAAYGFALNCLGKIRRHFEIIAVAGRRT